MGSRDCFGGNSAQRVKLFQGKPCVPLNDLLELLPMRIEPCLGTSSRHAILMSGLKTTLPLLQEIPIGTLLPSLRETLGSVQPALPTWSSEGLSITILL